MEICRNCKWCQKMEHNFKTGVGFEKSYACVVLFHIGEDTENAWIQEVDLDDRCEMFAEREV